MGMSCASAVILIHEAFALWVAQMIVALWYDRWRKDTSSLVLAGAALTVMFLLTAVVWRFDYARLFDFQTAAVLLQSRADFEVSASSLLVHYRSVTDNMAHTADRLFGSGRLIRILPGLLTLAALAWFLRLGLHTPMRRRTLTDSVFLALCVLAPLMLSMIGHDTGRWLSMVNLNLIVFFLMCVGRDGLALGRANAHTLALALLFVLWCAVAGSFGVTHVFPDSGFLQLIAGTPW